MAKTLCISTLILLFALGAKAKNYMLKSPDNKIEITISVERQFKYKVQFNGKTVIFPSPISFEFKNAPILGEELQVLNFENSSCDETWIPVLKRFDEIRNNYNSITIYTREARFPKRKVNFEFRVFNDGVAFRTLFPEQFGNRVNTLMEEISVFNLAADYVCWTADYGKYDTHQETEFYKKNISDISDKMVTGLPATMKVSANCYASITEADLTDYAGMYLKPYKKAGEFALRTDLAPRHEQPDNGEKVKFSFPHKSPWRVIMLAETPGELVESEIIQNLNDPCEIEDPSWIQPGVSAWDHWWSGEVKMEQDVIFQYIDLASEMGWPFMLIDWQWYGQFDRPEANIMKPAEQLDMKSILDYAKKKNVKCWLWLYWTDVDKSDWKTACELYEKWGVAGVKIDFMARDDQQMVNWYHRVVKTAAEHQLMVDFHGAYKPSGWRRTYPNLLTREGVLGNEYNKWSLRVTPEHLCTIPFTRMLAGPLDFTPGGFLNRMPDKFINGSPANVLGSRANTLAQFVIYDSPFLVACDHPDNYKNEVGIEYLKKVQSVWDDTKIVNGEIGEYITTVRRSKNSWFMGAITNSNERNLEVSLDFLPEGDFKMISFSDTKETYIDAEIAHKNTSTVNNKQTIRIEMVAGGGFAAMFESLK